ncbi:hypothetical protein ACWDRB_63360 [Nonomuraea sp. NPDC003707]
MITLYETNGDPLVITKKAADDASEEAWTLHIGPWKHFHGAFATDAKAWVEGDWEPNENDGQTPTAVDDDLREVATWDAEQGLQVLVRPDELGGTARDYLGVYPED